MDMARSKAILVLLLLAGCDDNPCVEMCQQYERWLKTCETTWEERFDDRGWKSIDDCYDATWGPTEEQRLSCEEESDRWWEKPCYESAYR